MKDVITGMGFEEVKPKKVSEVIYEQIRGKILSGELQPGDRLPTEKELIEQFQRSRPSVREALRMLESRNYITIARGQGAVVNAITSSNLGALLDNMVKLQLTSVDDVVEVRRVFEEMMYRKACANRSEEDMTEIDRVLKEGEAALDDYSLYLEKSLAFNTAVAKAAHDELLFMLANMVSYVSSDYFIRRLESRDRDYSLAHMRRTYIDHKKLAEAIREGDADKACKLNEAHLNRPYEI